MQSFLYFLRVLTTRADLGHAFDHIFSSHEGHSPEFVHHMLELRLALVMVTDKYLSIVGFKVGIFSELSMPLQSLVNNASCALHQQCPVASTR